MHTMPCVQVLQVFPTHEVSDAFAVDITSNTSASGIAVKFAGYVPENYIDLDYKFCWCKLERQKFRIRLGNRNNRIHHAQIVLKSQVPSLYPKMSLGGHISEIRPDYNCGGHNWGCWSVLREKFSRKSPHFSTIKIHPRKKTDLVEIKQNVVK